jgi:hypothetical protein
MTLHARDPDYKARVLRSDPRIAHDGGHREASRRHFQEHRLIVWQNYRSDPHVARASGLRGRIHGRVGRAIRPGDRSCGRHGVGRSRGSETSLELALD